MLNNKIKKDIFKCRQNKMLLEETMKLLKKKYLNDFSWKEIKIIYKKCKSFSDYYTHTNIPIGIFNRIINMYIKCDNPKTLITYFNRKYKINTTLQVIRTAASRRGIKKNKRYVDIKNMKLSLTERNDIIKEYQNNKTTVQLSKKYNCTPKTINTILKKHNIKIREKEKAFINNKKYTIDFDIIDTTFKAYYLGLLLTDGYVNTNRNTVGIQLCDKNVIKFIADKTNGSFMIIDRKKSNHKIMYRTEIYSSKCKEQLIRLGVVPNKSLILQGPKLYSFEKEYLPYILRGIIDGDGWIRKDGKEFFICSASQDFIKWCKEALEELGMTKLKYNYKENETNGIYCLRTSLTSNINILKNIIYNNPYGMERKYLRLHKGSETIIQTS